MRLTIKHGDLLDATEFVIAHQCNCVTKGEAAGVARSIFARFPDCDVYRDRTEDDIPGTWKAIYSGGPQILNLFSQFYPGHPRPPKDSSGKRLAWFEEALCDFIRAHDPSAIAMPYGIGCGKAGGHWPLYEDLLENISQAYDTSIVLYRL